jgi:hypothetical protein
MHIIDAIHLIKSSKGWTANDQLGMAEWVKAFKQVEAIPLLNKATMQYGCINCADEIKRLAGPAYPS